MPGPLQPGPFATNRRGCPRPGVPTLVMTMGTEPAAGRDLECARAIARVGYAFARTELRLLERCKRGIALGLRRGPCPDGATAAAFDRDSTPPAICEPGVGGCAGLRVCLRCTVCP